jgi:serine/threonine-protein kinase RsbW
MSIFYDSIELSLPMKAEYVSVARLTASAVASRIGFDIDTIEDIKVSIAEVCNKLLKCGNGQKLSYLIQFKLYDDLLEIVFNCEDKSLKCSFDDQKDELGLFIINALMDNVQYCDTDGYLLSMSKYIEGNRENG